MTSSAAEIAAELNAKIQREQTIVRDAKAVAEAAEAYAKSIAPVSPVGSKTSPRGAYKNSIHTERLPDRQGMPAYRVLSDSPIAGFLEYGTKHNKEFAVFAKTARRFQLLNEGDSHEYWGGYWGGR